MIVGQTTDDNPSRMAIPSSRPARRQGRHFGDFEFRVSFRFDPDKKFATPDPYRSKHLPPSKDNK